jgi:mannose-6-phosphate isomerase-like protein (cupin superfamily)
VDPISKPAPQSVAAEDTTAFWFLGSQMQVKATADETGGMFGLIDQTFAPPGFAAPPHVHHGEDEAFYILAGAITVHRGDDVFTAGPNCFVWLPRDVPHWFQVEGDTPVRLLQWTFPGGLEQFFVELGQPVTDSATPPAGPPDFGKLLNLASKYRVELLVPPSH